MTCENCGGAIGNLETPHVFNQHTVCAACYAKLSAGAKADDYRALGLDSRGMCIGVALGGFALALFFPPIGTLIGAAMIVWACIADYMLHKHAKRRQS